MRKKLFNVGAVPERTHEQVLESIETLEYWHRKHCVVLAHTGDARRAVARADERAYAIDPRGSRANVGEPSLRPGLRVRTGLISWRASGLVRPPR